MHIPDGFLDGRTAVAGGALAAAGLGVALARVRRTLPPRRVPLIGLAAAFVFAAQLLNFPVGGGTSGHLVGATLAAVLLGPSAAVVVMSAVLILQCLMFADGGLTALGTNVFNMAIVGGLFSYAVFRGLAFLLPRNRWGFFLAVGVASWFSVVLASTACAIELAVSGTVPLALVLPAMVGVHALIGVGEAIITVTTLSVVLASRPDLVGAWKEFHAEAQRTRRAGVP